jgi:hypothetical protein
MNRLNKQFAIFFLCTFNAPIIFANERLEVLCVGNQTRETTYMTKAEKIIDETRESKSENYIYVINGNEIQNRNIGTKNYKCKSIMNSIECTFEHGPGMRALEMVITTAGKIQIDRSAGTVSDWTVQFNYHKGGQVHRIVTSFNGNCQKIDRNIKKF